MQQLYLYVTRLTYKFAVRVCEFTSRVLLQQNKTKILVPYHNSRCRPSVSRLQKGCLQVLIWHSNQYTAITGTKTETALIREHNTSPLRFSVISSITSLKSPVVFIPFEANGMNAIGHPVESYC
ncbi:hypothetical protein TNCV_4301291 [Trichonephila clavipes]|uniref:Uncharacterized protein n=1 Tax=Trichonephila clavipes TaxID=2585209 RepID=A0A8X6V4G2_TRICX|nr:hypothetical protein TNCV_4301291 [Trichonephila clavipes]